jgi:uncharacterized tellurite resistance protein B-like protein
LTFIADKKNPMAELSQLKLLINLARIDGDVAEKEQHYIINIGSANGITPAETQQLFGKSHDLIVPDNLTDKDKFNYILSLVQLMKIDDRLYKDEIKYCSRVAAKLGYKEEVMFELMLNVKSAAMESNEIEALRKLTDQYLKK